jgi:conjugative transfer signal peptidase TraF
MKRWYRCTAAAVLLFIAAFMATVRVLNAYGIVINHTRSLPQTIWRIKQHERPLRRGDVISFCPPRTLAIEHATRRRFLPAGFCPGTGTEPLLKPIVALPGDIVEASDNGVFVNGALIANSAPKRSDSRGRRLDPFLVPLHIVPENTVWTISSYTDASFDSRYFGPVPIGLIIGVARPIF